MWARVAECMLGCWLVLSPFIFEHGAGWALASNFLISGTAVIAFSLASFAHRFRWAHWVTGLVAIWLIASGYLGFSRPGPPAAQNEIVIGLLLLLLFLVPNEASEPPLSWRRFAQNHGR